MDKVPAEVKEWCSPEAIADVDRLAREHGEMMALLQRTETLVPRFGVPKPWVEWFEDTRALLARIEGK